MQQVIDFLSNPTQNLKYVLANIGDSDHTNLCEVDVTCDANGNKLPGVLMDCIPFTFCHFRNNDISRSSALRLRVSLRA